MDRTNGADNINGNFTDGDPAIGQPATTVEEVWLNGVNNELVSWIEDTGQTPESSNWQQVREAAVKWVGRNNLLFNGNMNYRNDGRNYFSNFVPNTEGRRFADGWILKSSGFTFVNCQQSTNGFLISGEGVAGDVLTIEQEYSSDELIQQNFYNGLLPRPQADYTAAVLVGTFSSDNSVTMYVSVEHNPDIEQYVGPVTPITSSNISIGGPNDTFGKAYAIYNIQTKANEQPIRANFGPLITVELRQTGSFAVHIGGAGLWRARFPIGFIEGVILSDSVRDRALSLSDYYEGYAQDYEISNWSVPVQKTGTNTVSRVWLWIPFRKRLQFEPQPGDTIISNFAGVIHDHDGNLSGITSYVIDATVRNRTGIGYAMTINHASLTNPAFCVLEFELNVKDV